MPNRSTDNLSAVINHALLHSSCSHHAAIIQPSCGHRTTNISLPPTAPPSNHLAPAKLNFNLGQTTVSSLPPTAPPSNHLVSARLNFNWGQATFSLLPPTTPPSNHLAPTKLNFNWGYISIPDVSSSPMSCSLNHHK